MNKRDIKYAVSILREIAGSVGMVLTADEKAKYMASVLGSVIGTTLDMPSSPVDIPRNYFLTNHKHAVGEYLCAINEVFPINIDLAMSLADNVYLTRYRLVFEGPFMLHMINHLAKCSDDVVPTNISDILKKLECSDIDLDYWKQTAESGYRSLYFNVKEG